VATTAITGKQFTVEYDTVSGSAQITTGTIDETASSETIQTLAGSAAVSQGVESQVSCDFLYDGSVNGGFYAALKAALADGQPAVITIDGGGSSWSGDAIVTSLSVEFPTDGASTCSAEFTISGALPFTEVAGP
jgi:hypothetical protein